MRALLIFFVLVFSIYTNTINAQGWQWASGSTGGSEGFGIAVDHWGNVYASGFAGHSLDFGNGVTLSGLGPSAAIVVKYDPNGNVLWANGTQHSFAKPINLATDDSGNLYLFGYYTGTTLSISPFTLSNPGSVSELFLAKFSSSGNVSWVMNICPGNSNGNIVVSRGNIYLASTFQDASITIGSFTLTNADPAGITDDIVLVKTDLSGNLVWAKSFGGTSDDNALIALAPSGNIYMSGTTASPTLPLGGATLINPDTSFFIARLDTACNAVWAKNNIGIGKIGSFVSGITTSFFEDVYVTGSWRPTAYFGTHILAGDSTSNLYLVKYDSSGNMSWITKATGNGNLYGCGVTTDNCGNVWISGAMGDQQPGHHGTRYIDINGIRIDKPAGGTDPMFIAEWSAAGAYVKTALLPTAGDDPNSIASDGTGNIYVSGDYWFGPYDIAGHHFRDTLQPSENILVVKYLANARDTSRINSLVCMTDSVVLHAPAGYSFYEWDNGSLDTTRTIHTPGQYRLCGNGRCSSGVMLDVYNVQYGRLDTTYQHQDTSICMHARTILSAPAGYSPYLWSDGNTGQNDIISTPGTYWVVASGTCTVATVIDTFVVAQNNIDLAFSLGNDTDVCGPMSLSVPLTGVSYLWQDGSVLNSYDVTGTGVYAVTVSEQACFNADTIAVTFLNVVQHLKDTVLCRERAVQINLKANVPQFGHHVSVLWSTGATQSDIFVNNPGTYWVTVNDDGCVGSDTMTYSVMYCTCGATFPDAFTPNNDGRNDLFYPFIDNACNVFDYTFGIYDRWGNLLFWSHDASAKWDGTLNGVPQDVGVYMYFVKYNVGDVFHPHMQKGDVTLLR